MKNLSETDIDFCASEMRVSKAALLRLAEIAFCRSRTDAEENLRTIQYGGILSKDPHQIQNHAAALALESAARDHALAARMMAGFASLVDGTRSKFVLIETKK